MQRFFRFFIKKLLLHINYDFTYFLVLGPVTRGPKSPKPLFGGENSYIDDYFTGDIFAAFEEANTFDNAFMMFYAPWDADSIRAVKILEHVAKIFVDNDIYFAAVNCWEPKGNSKSSNHYAPETFKL